MATLTVYPEGDGYCEGGAGASSPWTTTHDQASADTTDYTGTNIQCGVDVLASDRHFIKRAFLPFDTSALPTGAIISSATLNIYVTSVSNSDNDGNNYIAVCETFQASSSTLGNSDYEDCGSDNGTAARAKYTPIEEGSDQISLNDLTTSTYNTLTLNATGRGWISDSGITYIGLREGHDLVYNQPDASTKIDFSSVNTTGTSQDPYLYIVYSDATTTSTTTSTTSTSSSTTSTSSSTTRSSTSTTSTSSSTTTTTTTSTSTSTSTTSTSSSSSTTSTSSSTTSTSSSTTSTSTTSTSTTTTFPRSIFTSF